MNDRRDLDLRVRRDPAAVHRVRRDCRACGAQGLVPFLDLGEQPLANSFLHDETERAGEPRFPLVVYFCSDCFLVQLADVIDPEILFRNYLYVTGTSDTISEHNQRYAAAVVEHLGLGPEQRVTEIASNDGSLLKRFKALGVRTLGVEPAQNIAARAQADGIETLPMFFGAESAERILESHGPSQAVIGNNVLAHVDDTLGFLRGARKLLAPGGRVIVEVPYLGVLLQKLEYDTVYHEHLCYFSVAALARLCENAGLRIERVDDMPVHGGTIRVYAADAAALPDHSPAVRSRIEAEVKDGLTSPERYHAFASAVAEQRRELRALLGELRAQGKSVAGYGAPAKGNTLLNYCEISRDSLPYVVDKSPLKVGLLTPGSHIRVLPVAALLEQQPDYLLILAWNFADEVMAQQREYQARGGKFIIPIPRPRVVS